MAYSRGSTLNSARRLRNLRATGETHRQSALMFDLDTLFAIAASGLLAGIAGYLTARRAFGEVAEVSIWKRPSR